MEMQRRLPLGSVETALARQVSEGALCAIDGAVDRWLATSYCDALVATIVAAVKGYEVAHPLEAGFAEAEIPGVLAPPERHLACTVVARALSSHRLVRTTGILSSPGRTATVDAETRVLGERVLARYLEARLTPPSDVELATQLELAPGRCREVLALLRRQHVIEKVSDEFHAHVLALDALAQDVAAALRDGRVMTAAEFKEFAGGISRKFAIPLLEYLDRKKVTLRQGNVRRLHPARALSCAVSA